MVGDDKETFMDTASQMPIWTHCGYDSIHKHCVRSSQTKSPKWKQKVSIKAHHLAEELLEIGNYREGKS